MSNRKKTRNTDLQPVLKKALEEYKPDILRDGDESFNLKEVVDNLPDVDRIVILLYAELQSYAQLAKILGVSKSTCFWIVKRIKGELRKKLEHDT